MSNHCECKSLFRKLGKTEYELVMLKGPWRGNGGESYWIAMSNMEKRKKEYIAQIEALQCKLN